MFVFKATSILNEIRSFAPDILKNCEQCLKLKVKGDLDFLRIERKSFINCESISIDISVFEKNKKSICNPS